MKIHVGGKSDFPANLRMLIAGEPFSGKLQLACQAPNPLVLNVGNAGNVALASLGCRYIDIEEESDLLELKKFLQTEDYESRLGGPVDTLILNTVDELQRVLFMNKLRQERRLVISRDDWGWMGVRLNAIFSGLKSLEQNLIFLTGLKTDESGMRRTGIQGAFGDQVHNYVDMSTLLTSSTYDEVGSGIDDIGLDEPIDEPLEFGEQSLFLCPLESASWVGNDLTTHKVLTVTDSTIDMLLDSVMEERSFLADSETIVLDDSEANSQDVELPGMSSDEDLAKIL